MHKLMQQGGQPHEDLFSVQACSVMPDLVACLSTSSSQISVVSKTMQAIRQHVMNDTLFQQQHKAFTQAVRNAATSSKVGPGYPHCPRQTCAISPTRNAT